MANSNKVRTFRDVRVDHDIDDLLQGNITEDYIQEPLMHTFGLMPDISGARIPCYMSSDDKHAKKKSIARLVMGALPHQYVYPIDGNPYNCTRKNLAVYDLLDAIERNPTIRSAGSGGYVNVARQITEYGVYYQARVMGPDRLYACRYSTPEEAAAAASYQRTWLKDQIVSGQVRYDGKAHTAGLRGVSKCYQRDKITGKNVWNGKFVARMERQTREEGRKRFHLGVFDTAEEAAAAYVAAKAKYGYKPTPKTDETARFCHLHNQWRARVRQFSITTGKWRWTSVGYYPTQDEAEMAAQRKQYWANKRGDVMRPA